MTTILGGRDAAESMMLGVPRLLWRALPSILAGGVGIAVAGFVTWVGLGPASPWWPLSFALLAGAPVVVVVRSVHRRLGDEWPSRSFLSALGRAVGVMALPAGGATATLLAAIASRQTALVSFQVALVVGAVATAFLTVASVAAVPLAVSRHGRLRAVWTVAIYATVRTPLPPLAVAAAGLSLAWVGVHGLVALTALAAGAVVAIGVVAGWVALDRSGVNAPRRAGDTHSPLKGRP